MCTTRPWGQQHETINGSLQYLVTEEKEKQDTYVLFTDRQTDGLMTCERVSHKLDWSSRAKNCYTFDFEVPITIDAEIFLNKQVKIKNLTLLLPTLSIGDLDPSPY